MKLIATTAMLGALMGAAPASAQTPASPCGATVTVQRNDTLSRIAERCDVTERRVIRSNPSIEGSRDLRVGSTIRLDADESGGSLDLDSLGSFAGDAADAVAGLARDAQSTVNDILDKNPDLRQRLERFGGAVKPESRPAAKPSVTVTPMKASGGDSIAVAANGLPAEEEILVGIGSSQGAYEVVQRARSGPDGTLRVDVRLPDFAADLDRVVVVVTNETASWKARSMPVSVEGRRL